MKCYKCGKEMDRKEGQPTLKGIAVDVEVLGEKMTQETIDYNNLQLGKYSDGNGQCHIAICYECYIDGLFQRR